MDGRLSQEQKQEVVDWINKKSNLIGKCTVCAQRSWTVLDHLVYAPVYYGKNVRIGGPSYPNAGLICENCGHTIFINAVKAGLVSNDDEVRAQEGERADD